MNLLLNSNKGKDGLFFITLRNVVLQTLTNFEKDTLSFLNIKVKQAY